MTIGGRACTQVPVAAAHDGYSGDPQDRRLKGARPSDPHDYPQAVHRDSDLRLSAGCARRQ